MIELMVTLMTVFDRELVQDNSQDPGARYCRFKHSGAGRSQCQAQEREVHRLRRGRHFGQLGFAMRW